MDRDAGSRFRLALFGVVLLGVTTIILDVLKKTVFLEAPWNYTYPFWNFVYDVPILAALIVASAGVVLIYPRLLNLPERRFVAALYAATLGVFLLALYALPLEKTQAFDVHWRGLHNAAVFLTENGLVEFLSEFHSLPGSVPQHEELTLFDHTPNPHEERADQVASMVARTGWVPFNGAIADCIATIIAQKHGPGSVFLVVPFVLLSGGSVAVTALGSFGLTAMTPVLGYLLYRRFFTADIARTVALLTAFAPALFFFTRQGSPVPYDVFIGLYLSVALLLVVRGFETHSRVAMAGAGAAFSLALLTKLTALFLIPTLVGLVWFYAVRRDADVSPAAWGGATAVALPIALLTGGYNFVCQLAFTAIKFFVGSRGDGGDGAAANLADPLIARLTPLYNARWMSIPLFVLAGVFVWSVISDRGLNDDVDVFAALLGISLLPFGLYIVASTGTLSRHMVPFLVPLGFVAARGFERVASDQDAVVRFGRVSLVVTLASLLINI